MVYVAPGRSSRDGTSTEMTSASTLRRSKTDTISTHYYVDKRRRDSITNEQKYKLIRAISLDSSIDYDKFSTCKRELEFILPINTNDPSRRHRCISTGGINIKKSTLMRRITFVEVDLKSTPLDNSRSLSEFNKNNLNLTPKSNKQRTKNDSKTKSPGLLSRLFKWSSSKKHKNKKVSISTTNTPTKSPSNKLYASPSPQRIDSALGRSSNIDDENLFFVENMTGAHSSHDLVYDDFDEVDIFGNSNNTKYNKSNWSTALYAPSCMPSFSTPSKSEKSKLAQQNAHRVMDQQNKPLPSPYKSSITSEVSTALDMVFGFNANRNRSNWPMEIELKQFSSKGSVRRDRSPERSGYSTEEEEEESRGDMPSASVSHRTIERIVSELSLNANNIEECNHTIAVPPPLGYWARFNNEILPVITLPISKVCAWSKENLFGPNDDLYYETVRIQPFASGAYLRGILATGFSSLFFNAYCIMLWPSNNNEFLLLGDIAVNSAQYYSRKVLLTSLYTWLIIQFVLNVVQLPARLNIHYRCWESSRAVEVDGAVNTLRNMVHCDSWVFNRVIGRIQDIIAVLTVVFAELFLLFSNPQDKLRSLVISICATNVLTFIVRLVVVTAFTVSMHDPQVLSDARRRGLSRWDTETLPTFVYTKVDDANNCDCSICLAKFDMGEMLISLPCDRKHSFHACCIRQWLQRQNSCPLCQKLV